MFRNIISDNNNDTNTNYAKPSVIISTSLVFKITPDWFLFHYAANQNVKKKKTLCDLKVAHLISRKKWNKSLVKFLPMCSSAPFLMQYNCG